MKPVEATWEGRGVRRDGVPWAICPTGTSCTQSWMQLRNRLDIQLRNVCRSFRVLRLVAKPLDPPAPSPGTPGIFSRVKGQDRESA